MYSRVQRTFLALNFKKILGRTFLNTVPNGSSLLNHILSLFTTTNWRIISLEVLATNIFGRDYSCIHLKQTLTFQLKNNLTKPEITSSIKKITFSKWMVVFQFSLDCLSIEIWAFGPRIKFLWSFGFLSWLSAYVFITNCWLNGHVNISVIVLNIMDKLIHDSQMPVDIWHWMKFTSNWHPW